MTFSPVDSESRTVSIKLVASFRPVDGNHTVVVLVHGLHGSRQQLTDLADSLHQLGYGTLAVDLRGHGKSGGTFPFEEPGKYGTAADDLRGAIRWVKSQASPPPQLALVGISLGGGAVIANALEQPDIPFVAWYPGLTYLHAGDSLVRASTPAVRGLIIQGTLDSNPRANPSLTRRFLSLQPRVGVRWIEGGAHGAGADRATYLGTTLDSLRAWLDGE